MGFSVVLLVIAVPDTETSVPMFETCADTGTIDAIRAQANVTHAARAAELRKLRRVSGQGNPPNAALILVIRLTIRLPRCTCLPQNDTLPWTCKFQMRVFWPRPLYSPPTLNCVPPPNIIA